MEFLSKTALIVFVFSVLGCGVKGRPLPPLNPAPLGRGEPLFQEPQKKPVKKISPTQLRDEDEETSKGDE